VEGVPRYGGDTRLSVSHDVPEGTFGVGSAPVLDDHDVADLAVPGDEQIEYDVVVRKTQFGLKIPGRRLCFLESGEAVGVVHLALEPDQVLHSIPARTGHRAFLVERGVEGAVGVVLVYHNDIPGTAQKRSVSVTNQHWCSLTLEVTRQNSRYKYNIIFLYDCL